MTGAMIDISGIFGSSISADIPDIPVRFPSASPVVITSLTMECVGQGERWCCKDGSYRGGIRDASKAGSTWCKTRRLSA